MEIRLFLNHSFPGILVVKIPPLEKLIRVIKSIGKRYTIIIIIVRRRPVSQKIARVNMKDNLQKLPRNS